MPAISATWEPHIHIHTADELMNIPHPTYLLEESIRVLQSLIRIPSVSRTESEATDFLFNYLTEQGASPLRLHNNVWACSTHFQADRPTLLLNAHIDTVKPNASWTRQPYIPSMEGTRLYGLGSNDCGGGLCTLMQVFLYLREQEGLPYNLVYLASAEEEVSGKEGIESVLPRLPHIDVALVGEPTGMQPAIAEKGLMVIDATAHGKAGHAARNEGDNAIYHAMKDIQWLSEWQFPDQTDLLGPVKNTVTIVNAGTQHNVIPDTCTFTIDVRSNECYSNEEIFEFFQSRLTSTLKARSFRLSSSRIELSHPFVQVCLDNGMKPFGSPTLSDQALMRFPSLKLGPGESSRSHTADEYIKVGEIEHAIGMYVKLLSQYSARL